MSGRGGEEFQGSLVTDTEGGGDLAAEEEGVGEGAERAEGWLVLDGVLDEGSGLAGSGLGGDGVAVAPEGEGAFGLDVAEAFQPAEVFDDSDPGETQGKEWDGADGDGEGGAAAGDDGVGAGEGCGRRMRSDVDGTVDAGLLRGGHEAGEIGGVGEEGEDLLERVGQPLFRGEVLAHVDKYGM